MFKFVNPKIEILNSRIKDLEFANERLIIENSILNSQLNRAQDKADSLQEKLFNLVGINRQQSQQINVPSNKPIEVGSGRGNWNQTRQALELRAKEKYWTDKNKEVEESIGQLETEIGISISDEVKAN